MWLFALLKHNVQRECIKERLFMIHHAFIDFLSDDSGKKHKLLIVSVNFIIFERRKRFDVLSRNRYSARYRFERS